MAQARFCSESLTRISDDATFSGTYFWRVQNLDGMYFATNQGFASSDFYTYDITTGKRGSGIRFGLTLYPAGRQVDSDGEEIDTGDEDEGGVNGKKLLPELWIRPRFRFEESVHVTATFCIGTERNGDQVQKRRVERLQIESGCQYHIATINRDDVSAEVAKAAFGGEMVISCTVRHAGGLNTITTVPVRHDDVEDDADDDDDGGGDDDGDGDGDDNNNEASVTTDRALNQLKLYQEGLLTDATISADEKVFKVHKVILASESPVFLKIYSGAFSEAKTRVVKIRDMSAEACEMMIRYIYGERITEDASRAVLEELLLASDKYELTALNARVEKMLCARISHATAAHFLVLADRYRADTLKVKCHGYIHKHLLEVAKADTEESWDNVLFILKLMDL